MPTQPPTLTRPLLLACLLLAGCTTGPRIDTRYAAKSQDSRVQFIVLHYTEGDFPTALRQLTEGDVSSHYLVDRDPPTIYRLVDENRRAWHAGRSYWQGYTFLNASSIGIEIVNAGDDGSTDGSYASFPAAQVEQVIALVRDVAARHGVKPHRIVGHAEIQPQTKRDPGPAFPWKRLADEGLVPWPDESRVAALRPGYEQSLPDAAWFQEKLARHGYDVPRNGSFDAATRTVLSRFQMRYRPTRYDGEPDAETAAILDVATTPGGLLMIGADGQRRPYTP